MRRVALTGFALLTFALLIFGYYLLKASYDDQAARIASLKADRRALQAQLLAHGITPSPGPVPASGGVGGRGGNGGPGGTGGRGGNGANGGNGAAVTVILTPAPGPSGSPGAAGRDGADSTVPGPQGPQGSPGPDSCQWQNDPLQPGTQTCTRPSPTP